MRLIAAAALACLAACSARNDGSIRYSGNPNDRYPTTQGAVLDGTGRMIEPPFPTEAQRAAQARALAQIAADSEARLAAAQALAVAKAKLSDGKKLSPLEMAVIAKADLDEQRAAIEAKEAQARVEQQRQAAFAEHRARAECSYKAQEANSNSFGLVHGFFAGLGTGSACINYYREIGIIR